MKDIKSKELKKYVMTDLCWKVDLPSFLHEIATGSTNIPYKNCFIILKHVLTMLAQRAIELNDPALNIIMLNLSLYEGSHEEDISKIKEKLRKEIEHYGRH